MEYKSITTISITKDTGNYMLSIPYNAPIGEAYDVVHQFLEAILIQAKDAAMKAKPKDITEAENAS